MNKDNNTVTMHVPAHMVDELEQFMQNLQVVAGGGSSENVSSTAATCHTCNMCIDDTSEYKCEVKRVLQHRRTDNGQWQFQLSFTDGTCEWVDDDLCECEWVISQYLKNLGIRTAYIFCRVSTKAQGDNPVATSLDAQAAELKELATDYDRIRIYKISRSAYHGIPNVLQRIGEAALRHDAILVWRVDRLSRNIIKYLAWLEDLHERGVSIFSHNDNMRYDRDKLAFIQCILDAQKEAKILGERVKLSVKRKRARGDEAVGGLPFGKRYRRVLSADGKHTVRKIVVDHIDEIALLEQVLGMSGSPVIVAEKLNRMGLRKRGRSWSARMVKRLKK